jgi:hypothetical protein
MPEQNNPIRTMFTPDVLALLLIGASFGNELKTPEQVTLHNDRMKLIRGIIGNDSKMPEFIKKVAQITFTL